jgi:hypothetical protein
MNITIVKEAKNGIEYLKARVQTKQSVYTEAVLWKIPRTDDTPDFSLKLGRYKMETDGFLFQEYSAPSPKCEITLDDEELINFISFLQQVYEPFIKGVKSFITVDKMAMKGKYDYIKYVLENTESDDSLKFIVENNVIPKDLLDSLELIRRKATVEKFENLLNDSNVFTAYKEEKGIRQDEAVWQSWFTDHAWLLGNECVEIIDERRIDSGNIVDFIVKSHDGFLDLVEIKKSNGLSFWAKEKDHNNCVPSTDLVKAITQSIKYLYEIEREANSAKFIESVKEMKTIKPRITLIFGRSNNWAKDEKEAFRILNSSYHSLYILTYDHILERARRNTCFS